MSQQEACFIFDWRRSRWDYRLPLLIALSLFGHVFCFYVFHVIYPTTTALLPPSAQVTVLDPNNPQDRSLLDWIEMNNPANLSAPRFDPGLVAQLTPQYKPIFSSLSVELKAFGSSGPRDQGIPSIFSPEVLLPMRSRPAQTPPTKMFSSRLEIAPLCKRARRFPCRRYRALSRFRNRPRSLLALILMERWILFFYDSRAGLVNLIRKQRNSFAR